MNQVKEGDENNNCLIFFFELIDPAASPDLDITAVTVREPETGAEKVSAMTVETGDKHHIHVTAKNVGDRKAQNFKIKYYYSDDTDFNKDEDTYIAFDQVETVGTGDTHIDRKTKDDDNHVLKAPEVPGTYYVFARISSLDEDENTDNDYSDATDAEVLGERLTMTPPMTRKSIGTCVIIKRRIQKNQESRSSSKAIRVFTRSLQGLRSITPKVVINLHRFFE